MQNRKSPIAAIAVGVLSVCLSPIANGGVLVLKNGDRITGEISAIWDHEITIEPTYSDEFKVDSEVVAYIESSRKFDIELADGREFSATLKGANEEGEQIFVVDGNQIAAPFMQLYELDEKEQDLINDDLEIYHNDSITYYVDGRDNTIFKSTTGLRYEITDLLYANFSIDYDYETDPAATATNEDLAMLFGVGI